MTRERVALSRKLGELRAAVGSFAIMLAIPGGSATGTTDHPILGPVPTCDRHHHFARKEWRHTCKHCAEPIIPGSWRTDDRRVIGHWIRPDVFERRDVPGFHEHAPAS